VGGIGVKVAALALFALLAWRLEVWTDRGAVKHRARPFAQ
jgi:hypothetical protein